MLMKSLFQYKGLFITSLFILSLISCSDDDDIGRGYSEYKDAIVGEWYSDVGLNSSFPERCIIEFGQDDSYSVLYSLAETDYFDYERGVGSYTIKGNKMRLNYVMYEMNMVGDYNIISVGKYDQHLFFPSGQAEEKNYRIVQTIHLKLGDTYTISIIDPDFHPEKYFSDDALVAEVNASGVVNALRQGTAYILVSSSIGTAVVRVIVESDTFVDNVVKYMGEQISKVTSAYGNNYYEISINTPNHTTQGYFLQDDIMEQVNFIYDKSGIVDTIKVRYRNKSDILAVTSAFQNEYQYVTDFDGILYYTTNKNARKIRILLDESERLVLYYYADSNDPYALIDDDLHDLAAKKPSVFFDEIGIVLTEEDISRGFVGLTIDNKVFPLIFLEFDLEKDIFNGFELHAKEGVTWEEIDSWYGQHYIPTGYEDRKSYRYLNRNPSYYIRFIELESNIVVYYNIRH